MRTWPLCRMPRAPRPNLRLAELPARPAPSRLRLTVDWLLRSHVLWRVK
mgnify:CR=1 FL=1